MKFFGKKQLFALAALLTVAALTGVTFAQVVNTTSVGISTSGTGGAFVDVKTASEAGFSNLIWGANPSWSAVQNSAGSISRGDLYFLDTTGYAGDVLVTLYLTNTPELSANYTYLLMQTNVYSKTSTEGSVSAEQVAASPVSLSSGETKSLANKPVKAGSLTLTTRSETAVTAESLVASGTAIAASDTDTLAYAPVKAGSYAIKNGAASLTEGTDYSINTTTGVVTFLLAITGVNNQGITADYTYYTGAQENVVAVRSENVVGQDISIAANETRTLARYPVKTSSDTISNGSTTLVRDTDYSINTSTGVITFLRAIDDDDNKGITAGYTYLTSELARGTDYTIAYDTGVITFLKALTSAQALKAAYTYYTYSGEVVVAAGSETLASGAVTLPVGTIKTLANAPVKSGSETVKNGATTLTKDTDYTIDYQTGKVTLLTSQNVASGSSLTAGYTYGPWQQATLADGSAITTTNLTLQNGFVDFVLSGNAYYNLTVDSGTFYCISTVDDDTHDLGPLFYIDVRPV